MPDISPELKAIFCEALDCPAGAERQAFLERACAGDQALRARIDALLAAGHDAGDFLEQPVPAPSTTWNPPEPLETSGTIIGPYKLLEQIGEGGMGTVYMAEQQQPVRRKVALKIIKPGMDSRQVIARFEAERQALAMMDHQNIARVLDAGTTGGVAGGGWRVAGREEIEAFYPSTRHAPRATPSGRPYFVMELVHGVPITQFCDERKLTLRDRLELLVPVCQAIQHAHQKGIIHRDIKPSNVLVTMYDDKPVPKVIDFGVAKAVEHRLTEKTMFTQFGALVGTFEYMSPEQAEMNAFGVDTRSDIYSLGVLLYELLTGTTPLEQKRLREAALTEMVRLIKEEEAPRPSVRLSSSNNLPKIAAARNTDPGRLSGIVRGELDWIVMKCLEKDRTRRYESANGLARDIQRYLADEPVEACPPSAGYRLRKFAHKYRTPLRVAGAFVLLVTLAAIAGTYQAIRATLAENRASEQRDIARRKEVEAIRAREETTKAYEETSKAYKEVAVANQNLKRTARDLHLALYVSDLNRAYKFWDEGNVERVEELLDRHRPGETEEDLRGVEWHYLRRLATRFQAGRIADAHAPILDLAISPDARSLATSISGGALKVWEAETGALRFQIPNASAGHVAYTANGGALISAGAFQAPEKGPRAATVRVRAWDVSSGKEMVTKRVDIDVGEVGQHALIADGSALLGFTPDDKLRVRIWDLAKRGEIATLDALAADPTIERAMMHFMALSPDRKTLVWQLGPTTMVWDVQTKKIRLKHFLSHPWTFAVAISPDGKLVACHRGGPPHIVQLWDWSAGKQLAELQGFAGHVYVLAFSPDGKLLATGDEFGTIRLFDVANYKEVATVKGHGGTIHALVFAPDERWLYSAGFDGSIRRWKPVPDPDPDQIDGDVEFYPAIARFSPDGRSFFTYSGAKRGGTYKVIHRDFASGRELARFQTTGRAVVSGDGRRMAFQKPDGRTISLWDVFANRELASLESNRWSTERKAFSADGRILALSEPDQIKLWDSGTGKHLKSLPLAKADPIAFSPDGRLFAASATKLGEAAPSVSLWKMSTLTEAAKLTGPAIGLTFSPDGQTLAVIQVDRVALWDIDSQVVRATLGPSPPDGGYRYSGRRTNQFSPDGKLFAILANTNVQVWNTATGELVGALAGPPENTTALAWSPDGKTLATSSGPKVKLWNVATRQELTTLLSTNGVGCHVFAPDGSLLIGDQMNRIRLWRTGLDKDAR
jgi:WD40 repeat protein/serine/threonine protein kinase